MPVFEPREKNDNAGESVEGESDGEAEKVLGHVAPGQKVEEIQNAFGKSKQQSGKSGEEQFCPDGGGWPTDVDDGGFNEFFD